MTATLSNNYVPALIEMLDREIELLTLRGESMQGIYDAIVNRNEQLMESSLAQLEQTQQRQDKCDNDLRNLTVELAKSLKLPGMNFRLEMLAHFLPPEQAKTISQRQLRIRSILKPLRRLNMELNMLLSESARINRMMIESLLSGSVVSTYGSTGTVTRQFSGGLMNAEL